MEDQDIHLVMQSFGRCTLTDDFLVTFYETLTRSSDEIAAMFAKTDMPSQRRLLKEGMIRLIAYASDNDFAVQRVKELGQSHSRTQLNVRPEMYEIWVDSLIEAIRQHDPECSDELKAAWRRIVAPGIAAMQELYSQ